MKIFEIAITALTSEGRITLQVPDFCIGTPIPKQIEAPDDWFVRLNGYLPSPRGCLFLSRKGWEANKEALWLAFAKSRFDPQTCRNPEIVTREQFEVAIEKEFQLREDAVQKKIKSLKKQLSKLEAL